MHHLVMWKAKIKRILKNTPNGGTSCFLTCGSCLYGY